MVALGIVLGGSELGVMIQMPARELARGHAARHRVEVREEPFPSRARPLEDRMVDDLVQQNREVEDGEALHECQRNPDQRVREADKSPRHETEDCELPGGNEEMTPRRARVELDEKLPRQLAAQLDTKRCRRLAVIVGLHAISRRRGP